VRHEQRAGNQDDAVGALTSHHCKRRVGGARAFVMASSVGAVKGADDYIAAIEYNVTTLADALK
jgi:hypothetical protein